MNYHNAYPSTDEKTFFVLVCTRVGRYIDRGYTTIEEAAWQADRAKFVLNAQGLLGRLSAYNFPDRLTAESESAWSVVPATLPEFLCKHINTAKPISEEDATYLEEAKRIAEINQERQRLLDEATKKLSDEKNEVLKAKLLNLSNRAGDVLREFDALHLPKPTRDHNAIAAAVSAIHLRLTQL